MRQVYAQIAVSLYHLAMLLSFRCKNFRSIREVQELSLIAAKTRVDERDEGLIDTQFEDLKLVRSAALYGANASGKSNLLAAFSAFRKAISDSQRLWKPNGRIPVFEPFLLDEESRASESEFEMRFILDATIYRYGFAFDQTTIRSEWLVDTTNRDKVLFWRTTNETETSIKYPNRNLGRTFEELRHLESIRLDVRPNSLFLSASAQKNHPTLSKVYAYLIDSAEVIQGRNVSSLLTRTAEACSDGARRERIVRMMASADTGIDDLQVSRQDMPDSDKRLLLAFVKASKETNPDEFIQFDTDDLTFPSQYRLSLRHRGVAGRSYPLEAAQESDGTLAFFSILGPLLDRLRDGTILMIDELESSLHPTLARELVRLFVSPDLNPRGAQVIFTTHSTNLLDLSLLRRDQVWFTEKTREGATILYPLSDYRPRLNQNIEAGYLAGRFGAIPFVDTERIGQLLSSEEVKAPSEHLTPGEH